MRKLVDLFCHVDDFCKAFLPQWQKLQLERAIGNVTGKDECLKAKL